MINYSFSDSTDCTSSAFEGELRIFTETISIESFPEAVKTLAPTAGPERFIAPRLRALNQGIRRFFTKGAISRWWS